MPTHARSSLLSGPPLPIRSHWFQPQIANIMMQWLPCNLYLVQWIDLGGRQVSAASVPNSCKQAQRDDLDRCLILACLRKYKALRGTDKRVLGHYLDVRRREWNFGPHNIRHFIISTALPPDHSDTLLEGGHISWYRTKICSLLWKMKRFEKLHRALKSIVWTGRMGGKWLRKPRAEVLSCGGLALILTPCTKCDHTHSPPPPVIWNPRWVQSQREPHSSTLSPTSPSQWPTWPTNLHDILLITRTQSRPHFETSGHTPGRLSQPCYSISRLNARPAWMHALLEN